MGYPHYISTFSLILFNCLSITANQPNLPQTTSQFIMTEPYRDVSSVLEPIVTKYNVPGMVAAVIHDNRIVASGAAGVRAKGHPEKITVNDLIHIGSDTKSMTATLGAILVEKGLINWDTKVEDVFPNLEKVDPAYKSMTFEQLFNHTSGLPANLDFWKIQKESSGDLQKGRQILVVEALKTPPAVKAGTFLYSNVGYGIAGRIEEVKTGRPWEKLMREYIFSPLGMASAGFGPPGTPGKIDQPLGHNDKGVPQEIGPLADNPSVMGPAGTVHLTIKDWAKYINMHLRGAVGYQNLLSTRSFEKLHTPVANNYAMGWGVTDMDWANGKILSHTGSNEYWVAKVWIAPKRDLAILVVCNQGGKEAKAACDAAGLELLKEQLNMPNIKQIDKPVH